MDAQTSQAESTRAFVDGLFAERETAKRLGVSYSTMIRLRLRGEIGFHRIATRVLYSEQHIQDFLAKAERKPHRPRHAGAK